MTQRRNAEGPEAQADLLSPGHGEGAGCREGVAKSAPPPRDFGRRLEHLLARAAQSNPSAIAVLLAQTQLSYGDLQARVESLAASLAERGIGPGDRVALMLPNTPTYVIAFYAVMRCSAVVVNLSPANQGRELAGILADCGPVALITLDIFLPGLYKVLPSSSVKLLVVTSMQGLEEKLPRPADVPAAIRFEELLRPRPPATAPPQSERDEDLAVLQYTSGSTGVPKGVMLSHRNLLANVRQICGWMQHDEHPNAGVLCVIPFFHVFGLTIGLHVSVAKGYRMLLVPRFDALDLMPLLSLIETQRPLSIPAVPTLWAALLSHPKAGAGLFSSVRVASSGGAPLPGWVQERYQALTGRPIYEAYGLSEAAGATHCSPFPDCAKPGSIGYALPGLRARLVEYTQSAGLGKDVAIGEVGELLIAGENVMQGYFKQPGLTDRVLREGWLHTGDLARQDAEGFFYIVDRKDDLILTSAYNVYPSEVEALLRGHPAVRDAAVIGKPDRLRGNVVFAYVVLKGEGAATVEELVGYCRDNLADYKVPRQIEFVASIPHNPAGKILRRALRGTTPQDASS